MVTLGSGLAVFALGVLASRDTRFEKAATPLLLVAAGVEPTGMLVAFEELGAGGDWHWAGLATAGTMALQFAALFSVLRRSMTLFVAVSFALAFWWALLDYGDVPGKGIALLVGAAALAAAIAVGRTPHRDVTPLWAVAHRVRDLHDRPERAGLPHRPRLRATIGRVRSHAPDPAQ